MRGGWVEQALGEVCEIYQPEMLAKKDLPIKGEYPVFGANGQIGWFDRFNHEHSEVVLGCRGSCGSINVTPPRCWITSNAMVVRPRESTISKNLLRHILDHLDLRAVTTGVAQPQITRSSLAPTLIRYPASSAEQQRIVAILDEAFAGVEATMVGAEQGIVRALAVASRQLSNALRAAAGEFGTVPLGALCVFENGDRGANYPNKSARVAAGVPFINAGHLSGGRIDMSSMDYISPERFALLRSGKPKDGDVLFCLRGSLGKFGIVRGLEDCAIASSLVIVRPRAGVSADYIAAYFNSEMCVDMINSHRGGTAQPNLGAKQLAAFRVPNLDAARQAALVERAHEVGSGCDLLRATYRTKLAALAELKQSLLARAFSGELTREPIAA